MTSNFGPTLDALLSDTLADAAFSVGTPDGVYVLLQRRSEIVELKKALESGAVTSDQLSTFVSRLLDCFIPKQRFLGDIPLSAISIAVQEIQTPFATDFLHKLSELRANELPMSRRIAKLALGERLRRLGELTNRGFVASPPPPQPPPPPTAEGPVIDAIPHRVSATVDRPKSLEVA